MQWGSTRKQPNLRRLRLSHERWGTNGKASLEEANLFNEQEKTLCAAFPSFLFFGYNLQQTADAIEYEISCANKRIYGYEGLDERQVFTKLAQEVEKMRNEQQKRQQQLEQASETKHTTE